MADTSQFPRRIARNFNLYLSPDGEMIDLLGQCSKVKVKLPKVKTEDMRNAGMHMPMEVHMGFEKPELDFTISGNLPEILALYGKAIGSTFPFVLASALVDESTGITHSGVYSGFGYLSEMDVDDFEAGAKKVETKCKIAPRQIKYTEDNKEILYFDPFNIRSNGVDSTAAINRALLRA